VRIKELKSRVRVALPSAYPYRPAFVSMAGCIAAQGPRSTRRPPPHEAPTSTPNPALKIHFENRRHPGQPRSLRTRHPGAKVVVVINHEQEEPSTMNISTIGLDLAKNVFQVHGIDDTGKVIVRRSLRRRQVLPLFGKLEPCLIGMEACGTSHF